MKILTKSRSEEELEEYDYRDSFKITIETKEKTLKMDFTDGEPEDANLCRDFNDVYSIEEALVLAYNAGKNGETLEQGLVE